MAPNNHSNSERLLDFDVDDDAAGLESEIRSESRQERSDVSLIRAIF